MHDPQPEEAVRQWHRLLELQRPFLPDACAAVLPGATPRQLAAIEQLIGFEIPAEYRAVLGVSAGGLPLPNSTPMIDLGNLIEQWLSWESVAEESDDYSDELDAEEVCKMKVQAAYCHRQLLCLSGESGHGGPMVDAAPGPAGRVGQIVAINHGEGMSWKAWSVADYFHGIADVIEAGVVGYNPRTKSWIKAGGNEQDWINVFSLVGQP